MPNKASGPRRTAPPVVAQELEVSAVRTRRVFEDVCAQVRRQIEQGVLQLSLIHI